MKTAVDKVHRGKRRVLNTRFEVMASHFMFESDVCNSVAGWEKGWIEKNVRDSRYRLWHQASAFADIDVPEHLASAIRPYGKRSAILSTKTAQLLGRTKWFA
ncbi:hypothetical protein [Candidatus Vondammii sp. HM_W22]|uniref:hypothetical protein n=1 Tax=Candidatus Vondammii sp. HM_W22 TaxID=2687299 RepID=UPI002E7B658F|nr:hypothetical protein [Candidatus Vondammii sp. HM_W22]